MEYIREPLKQSRDARVISIERRVLSHVITVS